MHFQLKSPWIPAILLLLVFISITVARRASHGEACDRTIRCDSRGSLTCKNGTCQCIMPETMRFDARYGRCHVLAGEKCLYTAVEGETVARSWREELPCVLNSACMESFCVCHDGFYESSENGECLQKKNHREECESPNACRDDQLLICTDEKRCDCNANIKF